MTVPQLLILAIYVLVVFGFLYVGIAGVLGRPIAMPSRSGLSGFTARGGSARVIGVIFILIGVLLVVLPLRH